MEIQISGDEITQTVKHYIDNRGVSKSWFYERLGLTQPTFKVRLRESNWKESEILALKQLNIIK